MATSHYDAIVVGARCAGSPTAMLLARQGHKVLLVDKDHFPSDTLSTQMIHPPGVARLRKWGLLDRLAATGCPPIERYSFDFGPMTLAARPRPIDGTDQGFAPRRTIMDKLLVDAAVEAGAEVREGFCVDELLFEDGRVAGLRGHSHGGQAFSERARVVVGADGNVRLLQSVHHRHDDDRRRAVRLFPSNPAADGSRRRDRHDGRSGRCGGDGGFQPRS